MCVTDSVFRARFRGVPSRKGQEGVENTNECALRPPTHIRGVVLIR